MDCFPGIVDWSGLQACMIARILRDPSKTPIRNLIYDPVGKREESEESLITTLKKDDKLASLDNVHKVQASSCHWNDRAMRHLLCCQSWPVQPSGLSCNALTCHNMA